MNIYEAFGRLSEQYQTEVERHFQTIGVLRALKNGELSLEALTITDDNQWAIAPANSDEPSTEELPC